MVSIEAAQEMILRQVSPLPCEEVSLLDGLGRILCDEIRARWDMPLTDISAMDGYAFSHAGLSDDRLAVAGFVPAGDDGKMAVAPGEAVRIMTGAPIPAGCDTVVPLEDVEVFSEGIRLKARITKGSHIRKRGEEVRSGELVMAAGVRLRPQEIGLAVALGCSALRVRRKGRVAILATGDELLEPGETPVPGKIVNSNSYSIAAQLLEAGAIPVMQGIAPDHPQTTRDMILKGVQEDCLILTGGVSVGDRDFVKDAILELGGEILFWKVNVKPGKPVAFGMLQGKPVFALPGNPVAAMVCFEMFVRPALLAMMGHSRPLRPVVKAMLSGAAENRGGRPHLMGGRVVPDGERYIVSGKLGHQSSANLRVLTENNALLKFPPHSFLAAGDCVEAILLDPGFESGIEESEGTRGAPA